MQEIYYLHYDCTSNLIDLFCLKFQLTLSIVSKQYQYIFTHVIRFESKCNIPIKIINKFKNVSYLNLKNDNKLLKLNEFNYLHTLSIGTKCKLTSLNICKHLTYLYLNNSKIKDINHLINLKILHLIDSNISTIHCLNDLNTLYLHNSPIRYINDNVNLTSLEIIVQNNSNKLENMNLFFNFCMNSENIERIDNLSKLIFLRLENISRKIFSHGYHLRNLTQLYIRYLQHDFQSVNTFQHANLEYDRICKLKILKITHCLNPDIMLLNNLIHLHLDYCEIYVPLDYLTNLKTLSCTGVLFSYKIHNSSITQLMLNYAPSSYYEIEYLPSLKSLIYHGCKKYFCIIRGFEHLISLHDLRLEYYDTGSLDISSLTNLTSLSLTSCKTIKDVNLLTRLKMLKTSDTKVINSAMNGRNRRMIGPR